MDASDPKDEQFQPLDADIYKAYNQFRPDGPKELFCYVPFSNLSFSFLGRGLACVYNQKVEIGRYPQQSVREMWFESEMGQQLRRHMEHNDLSYGCKHCKYFVENRKFSGLKPLVFDKYSASRDDLFPRVLEFELSNSCNLECVMCNGQVSSAVRKNRDKLPPVKSPYDDEFVRQLEEFLPHIKEAKFYGGETFLIPIYYKIWDRIIDVNPEAQIFTITNGTTLNDRIKGLLDRGNFDLAVSMDSPRKEVLEKIRLNAKLETLVENILYYRDYCRTRGRDLTISFTLMRINWEEFPRILDFCNEIGARLYVSYLKTPPRFALWNLPAADLAEIRRSLDGLEFPTDDEAQKANKRCYEDLMVYLQNAEAASAEHDPSEIIPWQSGKTYPVEGWLDESSGRKRPPAPPAAQGAPAARAAASTAPAPDPQGFDAETDYEALLQDRMGKHLQSLCLGKPADVAGQRLQMINEKMQAVKAAVPRESIDQMWFVAVSAPIESVVENLEASSVETLTSQLQEILRARPS